MKHNHMQILNPKMRANLIWVGAPLTPDKQRRTSDVDFTLSHGTSHSLYDADKETYIIMPAMPALKNPM
jgi:hypothetical protein